MDKNYWIVRDNINSNWFIRNLSSEGKNWQLEFTKEADFAFKFKTKKEAESVVNFINIGCRAMDKSVNLKYRSIEIKSPKPEPSCDGEIVEIKGKKYKLNLVK